MPSSEGFKNLIPFVKGKSGNPKGRPRKFVLVLKDIGYNKQDVNDTIQTMMAMNIKELAEVFKDEEATILEKTVANAMRKSLEKGSLYSIETLMTRIYGQPRQESEIKMDANIVFKADFGTE